MITVSVSIMAKSGMTHRFKGVLHRSESPEGLFLHPEHFYSKFGEGPPSGAHYEVEIVEPEDSYFEQHTLEVHRSFRTGGWFMRRLKQVPTIELARRLFSELCLSAVLKVEPNVVMNREFIDILGDHAKLVEAIREQYGIGLIAVTSIGADD